MNMGETRVRSSLRERNRNKTLYRVDVWLEIIGW